MSYIKKPAEIDFIIKGGKLLGEILEELAKMSKAGVSVAEIDKQAEKMIYEIGGRPSFKGYKTSPEDTPFPNTICASINEELVHGLAKQEKILKTGDLFSIDIGMEYPYNKKTKQRGFYTDTALTVKIGEVSKEADRLQKITKKALEKGIQQCLVGKTVADIGRAIQNYVEAQGLAVIRDLVGHGVGHAVHEEPRVPNYYDSYLEMYELKPGVVLALEPMVALGSYEVEVADDGWGIVMADGKLSAHFEHTVIITDNGPIVATRRPSE